jgi:glutamate/tyrosine decarboxylase-like PLP-dependent enzyme
MANFVCFLAARRAMTGWDVRQSGLAGPGSRRLRIYASTATHTWVQKAPTCSDMEQTRSLIGTDRQQRLISMPCSGKSGSTAMAENSRFAVGNAGTVGCGAVDPLFELTALCREYGIWFHVDGATGVRY